MFKLKVDDELELVLVLVLVLELRSTSEGSVIPQQAIGTSIRGTIGVGIVKIKFNIHLIILPSTIIIKIIISCNTKKYNNKNECSSSIQQVNIIKTL